MHDGMTLGTLLGWRLAIAFARLLDAQVIDGAVTKDVAAKVENEAVHFVRVEPKSSPDHLVVEARGQGRPQHSHAVD
ncbi:MAG: hypothetical protein M5U09_28015 [Gammaproteobacteria bacterium]|nr:hypothetical protein [Gammaproteobacteria bacterium]